jgi:hypothetical protein
MTIVDAGRRPGSGLADARSGAEDLSMATLKTRPTRQSVSAFLLGIRDPGRRRDARAIAALMRAATGSRPRMWGPSIVGFGSYHYKYPSGREGDWFLTGFSARGRTFVLYIMSGFRSLQPLVSRLGKHKKGKACLYITSLADLDVSVLKKLIRESVRQVRTTYAAFTRQA